CVRDPQYSGYTYGSDNRLDVW
nr:immunoglobulin heavy chain junction region [Macaca mulatta]